MDSIEKRRAEIHEELKNEKCDVEALDKELKELDERQAELETKAAIEAEEKRQALLNKVVEEAPIVETFEETKMENRIFEPASVEYRDAWLKDLKGEALTNEERASVVAAAYVIPKETMNKVGEKLEQYSVLYSRITVTSFPNYVNIPVEATNADAAWKNMGSDSSDSADTYNYIQLTAHKIIKTITLDADVEHMSIPAFEAFIVDKLSKKLFKAIEKALLAGNGTSEPKGIGSETYATATNYELVASSASIGWDCVMNTIARLPEAYHQNATFIMNRKLLFGTLAKVKASSSGVPMFVMDREDGFVGNIMGYPVIIDEWVPDDTAFFGDLNEYHFNWAKPIEITKDASVAFRSGGMCYRGYALCDGELVTKQAFVKLHKST